MYVIQKKSHMFEYFKILNMYNYLHINHNIKFVQFLFELMKIEFRMKFVRTYE